MLHQRSLVVLGLLAAHAALAAPPAPEDYARGIEVHATAGRPLIEVVLPDEVYRTVTRADLADLRVFNAQGEAVAHELCEAERADAAVSVVELPVFQLREVPSPTRGFRLDVQTAEGVQVGVQESGAEVSGAVDGRTHIIDAREIDDELRAIEFEWQSPDGASQARVRIEASDDLDRWRVLVPETTLLAARSGSRTLERARSALPQQGYQYLRVQRTDGGLPLQIDEVRVERIQPADDIEPRWFTADPHSVEAETEAASFDANRLAPVRYARLRLPRENTSVEVVLQSRPDEAAPWRSRWAGEAYRLDTGTEQRESPVARFEPTADRYWRAEMVRNASLYRAASLDLGYHPARLRFLAQGDGAFIVAFGSRRAEPAPAARCESLLADVSEDDRNRLLGEGQWGASRALGGDAALSPQPQKTRVRVVVVLWGVLIAGVGLLVWMAVGLMRRVRS